MTKDPVCGMQVDEKKAVTATHGGQTFYFCSPACKVKFERDPDKIAGHGGHGSHHGH